MKVTINLDVTPEEMRRFLGLPDVQDFQKEMLDRARKQMEAGVEGYDPAALLNPGWPGGGSVEQFQKLMLQFMGGYPGADKKADTKKQ